MKKVVLIAALFTAGLGTAQLYMPEPADAARPRGCPYCRGDLCGRGTIGAGSCTMTIDGCTEGGGSCSSDL